MTAKKRKSRTTNTTKRFEVRLEDARTLLGSFDDESAAVTCAFDYNSTNQPEYEDAIIVDTKRRKERSLRKNEK